MIDLLPAQCPYCGEAVELDADPGGGVCQSYVQDCPVCCRPWQVELRLGPSGDWSVELRTDSE